MESSVPGVAAVVLLSAGVSSPVPQLLLLPLALPQSLFPAVLPVLPPHQPPGANAVMGSVEKQRINASNMLNTRFFIAFYLFPMGIVIPIILKITYHTFSQRNQGLHESTQICHESTEEDFKWLNAVQ